MTLCIHKREMCTCFLFSVWKAQDREWVHSVKYFCYYISNDSEERGIWFRKFACMSCNNCLSGIWDLMKQCTNLKCGTSRFVPFDFLDINDNPWLSEEQKLNEENLIRKIICPCGGIQSRTNYYSHIKTKRHQKYIKEQLS